MKINFLHAFPEQFESKFCRLKLKYDSYLLDSKMKHAREFFMSD